ncbi:MAG: glycosyltransferase 87 family protein [Alphaproteobacteria bacterium]
MGQLTVIWLLEFALAYRLTGPRNPAGGFASGAVIGVASLAKFAPALLLAPHIVARRYRALAAFGLVWLAALALIRFMHPGALARYLEINVGNSIPSHPPLPAS